MREATAFLGLGANLGDPEAQLADAVRRLGARVSVEAVSSVYLTEPVGGPPQPPYLNLVCRVRTALDPHALLGLAADVERELGRVRTRPNEPRTIDIDLLAYEDLVIATPSLTLPHPRMHLRAFVLVPLAEIAPDWRHPVIGRTARELIVDAGPLERVERRGLLPGHRQPGSGAGDGPAGSSDSGARLGSGSAARSDGGAANG